MMNENNDVFTMEDEPLATVVQNMRKGSKWLSAFLESYRPPLDGERYLTDREVALPVEFRLTGFNEKNSRTIRRTVTLPAGSVQQEKKVTLPVLSAGFYSANIRAGKEDWNFSLSVLPDTGKAPAGRLEEYLGTAAPDDAAILRKLGIRWMRSWGRPDFVWYLLEPSSGKFDFRTADALLEETHRNNVRVLAVLGYPPFWAAEPPRPTGKGSVFPISRDAGNPAP